ncbi:uncharacterized protein [Dermacentor andersoni]|uniref:uncharacterized protein n=1 Tax=Dermacentor andersoni TaxID=34620 RepID=UPI002417C221|nr:uncharacterized protein LOC126543574 [Dermacentor andersoni]
MNVAIPALLLVLLVDVPPSSAHWCKLKGLKKIDWEKFAGKEWYAAVGSFTHHEYPICTSRLYYPKKGRVVEVLRHGRVGAKSWNQTTSGGTLESDKIRFVKDNALSPDGVIYYQILDTDYTTWAVENSCNQFGSTLSLLLTKQMRQVPRTIMRKAWRAIRKAGYRHDGKQWFPTGCLIESGKGDGMLALMLVSKPPK